MRMCQAHWDKLKAEIGARGLDRFIAKDGAEAAERLASGGFDPLMNAHNAILSNCLNSRGLAAMTPNEDGSEKCQLCFCASTCTKCQPCQHFEQWIVFAAKPCRPACG